MQLVAAVALGVVLSADPQTPPSSRLSPEAELEQLLAAATAKAPPAEVVVLLDLPDTKAYRLDEAVVQLDGVPVAYFPSGASGPPPKGTEVSDGDHVVAARLVYRGQALGPYPWEEGPKWTLPARVALQASRGLRFTVRLVVELNAQAPVASQRLSLRSEVDPVMMVEVDDAPLPPPPVPVLPVEVTPVAATSAPPRASLPPKPTAAPSKPKKKKVARAPTPAAPAAATVITEQPAEVADPLWEATARLRSALAAPRDGGSAPAGGTKP